MKCEVIEYIQMFMSFQIARDHFDQIENQMRIKTNLYISNI